MFPPVLQGTSSALLAVLGKVASMLAQADLVVLAWNYAFLTVRPILLSSQVIHAEISDSVKDPWLLSLVYGSTNRRLCAELWNSLASLDSSSIPWVLLGDLNTTLNSCDKQGGRTFSNPRVSRALQNLVFRQGFEDLGFSASAPYFTWCNGQAPPKRIWSRIDRAFGNSLFLNLFPDCRVRHLPRTGSDHSPVLLYPLMPASRQSLSRPKRFALFWLDVQGLSDLVVKGLDAQVCQNPSDLLTALPSRLSTIFDLVKSHSWSALGDLESSLDSVVREIASTRCLPTASTFRSCYSQSSLLQALCIAQANLYQMGQQSSH